MGHWHLNSLDVEANKKIFVGMGGTHIKAGVFDIVRFPGVVVMLHLRERGSPPSGGTDGTVVNHVGFVVQNVPESVAKWKAAGVPVQPGNDNRTDQAYVTTPDGLKIEILEDKQQSVPIRHEHIHFFLPEAAIPESQAWYAKTFGAKPGVRNQAPVADVPGAQLRFAKTATPAAPTKGRVLDHIGFDVKDLQGFIKKLEAAGIKMDRPYTPTDNGGALAFISDPWGHVDRAQRTAQSGLSAVATRCLARKSGAPDLRNTSAIGEGQLGAERDKGGGEGPAHPRQYPRTRDHVVTNRSGEQPVADEDRERHQHENGAQREHARQRMGLVRAHELRQECQKEDRQLRIEDIDQDGRHRHLRRRTGPDLLLHPQGAALAQRVPGHIQEISDAQIFERLEGERAGVQERRQSHDRGRHVRNDADRAAERGHHARARSAREAGRQCVENAGSG
jgi:catechol 2,3-dioxygenase-like lactoylglutathione lyase family enzyme